MNGTDIEITVNNESQTSGGTLLEFTGIPKKYQTGETKSGETQSFNISFSAPVKLSRFELQFGGAFHLPNKLKVVLKDINSGWTSNPIIVINGDLQVPSSIPVVRNLQVIIVESDVMNFTLIADVFGCVKPGETFLLF